MEQFKQILSRLSDYINVTGPEIYIGWEPIPALTELGIVSLNPLTASAISISVVTLLLIILAVALTRKISKRPTGPQVIVEKLVGMLYGLVEDTMGKHNAKFAPYIGTLFLSSIFGSLIGMTGILPSATADLSVTLAWALVTTGLVWYHSIKNNGFLGWLKGFTEPVVVMTPMNIVSEVAQPLSMAFRHFGNVAGGSVLTSIIYAALAVFSQLLLSWVPNAVINMIPFLQVGIPAVLSVYFDLFSGFVQAFVFSLLTMVYVGSACPPPPEKTESEEKSGELPPSDKTSELGDTEGESGAASAD